MADYKTPGVYIEEIPHLPPSIASVETAIPAFIGYTEKAQWKAAGDLLKTPWRIESLLEYEQFFGFPNSESQSITVSFTTNGTRTDINGKVDETLRSKFLMHYSMQMFFANGGGPCWITSVGDYQSTGGVIMAQDLLDGLATVAKINEVTLLVFPDAINLDTATDYYNVQTQSIAQCVLLQDRFAVMDVYHDPNNLDQWNLDIQLLRNSLAGTTDDLKYAAVYFPRIYTGVDFNYAVAGDQTTNNDAAIKIVNGPNGAQTLADLKQGSNAQYFQAKSAITDIQMLLPAAGFAVAIIVPALLFRRRRAMRAG